ncbi:TonB-dependent receptor [Rhodobiaceae bacterium]|nr:TonB-dependent receptor [Rhodobiaceae bacterium]
MTTEIKAQAQEVEEIVVTGKAIKESQMAAIEAKRQAVNVADIISADAIGRFPDVNLSDALGRLPGISIERDQGQARYVSFRGTPKRYTTTAFNGISIPGVENGRIPRFDSYPAVITSQVIANKAITADMPGESISGFINIKTFKPSDIEGFSLSAEVGMGEQDQGGGDTSKENLRISYSDDSFGFVVYGSAHNNEQITDNREPTYGGVKGAQTPDRIDFRSYKVERESEAFGGTFEKYLDNGGRIFLTSLNTEFLDNEERNDFRAYVKNGTPTTGSGFTGSARRLFNDALYINKTEMNTLGIETSFGEWDIKAQASKIDTTFDTYMPIGYFIGGGQLTNLSYDISDPQNPIVNFDGTYRDVDYSTKLLVDAIGGLYTETDQFKIDISRENNRGELKFGLQYDDRVATGGGATLATVSVAGGYPADVCDPKEYRLGDFASPRDNSVGAFYTDNPALNDCLNTVRPPRSDFPDDEKIDIEEVLFAAYIMQTFEMDWGNIVAGLRIEDTEYETNGFRLATVSGDIGYENIAVGAKEVLSVKRTYTNYLPSVHINYDMSEDVKLRLSYSTGISRPSYIEARAAASINILSNEIAGGNPFLKQEESWGIDAAFEWYYDEASLFSITIFHREIDNVISESNEKVDGTLYSDQAQPGELWDLAGFGNGKDGELQGLEISLNARMDNYIDGFFSGFGASLNVALIESEYTTPEGKVFALPGQSDTNYNASIFYEDHGFSARLTYRYRSEWLDETETGAVFNLGGGVYWAAQNRLDASVRYDLEALTGQKASIFADFNNITDESDMRYTAQRWNVNQVESFGRSFLAGVRYAF